MTEQGKQAFDSDMLDKLSLLFGVPILAFEGEDTKETPLCTFHTDEISASDLEVIGAINRIALNSSLMAELLEKSVSG